MVFLLFEHEFFGSAWVPSNSVRSILQIWSITKQLVIPPIITPHQKWSFPTYLCSLLSIFLWKCYILSSLKLVIDLLWSLSPLHPNVLVSLQWRWKQNFLIITGEFFYLFVFLWVNIPKLYKWLVAETFVSSLEIECFHFLLEIIPFWLLGWINVSYMEMCFFFQPMSFFFIIASLNSTGEWNLVGIHF